MKSSMHPPTPNRTGASHLKCHLSYMTSSAGAHHERPGVFLSPYSVEFMWLRMSSRMQLLERPAAVIL
jgi:hypothetical protein